METKKEKKKNDKKLNEEIVYEEYQEKLKDIKSGKSSFFYACIIILNICMLFATFVLLNNLFDINCFELLAEFWSTKIFVLMIAVFVLIQILKTLPNFLKLYNKQKTRKFGTLFKANAVDNFYNCVTINQTGGLVASTDYMINKNIELSNAFNLSKGQRIIDKIAITAFSLIMLLVGAFLWVEYVNIWLYLLALFIVIAHLIYIVFVIIFATNKKRGILILGKLCKFLLNLKLIKDYEAVFNKMVNHMLITSKALKENKILMIVHIASSILVHLLRIMILYLALYSLGLQETDRLWVLIFGFIILDLIINILPLQKGTLVIEVLFVVLFSVVFEEMYVFYGLMMYKVFEYFMYVLQFIIVWLIDKITDKFRSRKAD